MLELKSYSKAELSQILGTRDLQGLKRKLTNYGVKFDVAGRGESAVFTITDIERPFKLYSIIELGFDAHTDFTKLRNYYYYFFNDEEFRAMPNEVQENRMRSVFKDVSRQTIANYQMKLHRKNFINLQSFNYIYYFAFKDTQIIAEREEYCAAWHEYWSDIANDVSSFEAIAKMQRKYGGVARKQQIPDLNGIYMKEIDYLCNLIQGDLESEIENFQLYN